MARGRQASPRSVARSNGKIKTEGFKYQYEQNAFNEGQMQWEANVPYIHWHIENAKRAAGGTDIATITAEALAKVKNTMMSRFNTSVYSGNSSLTDMKKFSNSISDINSAVSDSQYVMDIIKDMVEQTVNYRNTGLSASQVAAKISSTIHGVMKSKDEAAKLIDEILRIMYDDGLDGLIKSLSKQKQKLTPIKQDQLASLIQLQELMNKDGPWGGKGGRNVPIRNTLVDILTEQGLPDFLAECAQIPENAANRVVAQVLSATQLGKVHVDKSSVGGRDTQGKIDTQITFLMPNGRKITQGISLKSNYGGWQARILGTTILATLKSAAAGNQYAMVNAASLMTVDELKRWMEWANIDRALQGTMLALKEVAMQDRADLLIEFTNNAETGTFQVHNINYLMYKLVEKIKATNGNIALSEMGWGMSGDNYTKLTQYNRTPFDTTDVDLAIKNRSEYTENWIKGQHSVVLNANALLAALNH